MAKTDRERIANALYALEALADKSTLLATMRAYVVVHSKSDAEVTGLLRDLKEANPEVFIKSLKTLKVKPEQPEQPEQPKPPKRKAKPKSKRRESVRPSAR